MSKIFSACNTVIWKIGQKFDISKIKVAVGQSISVIFLHHPLAHAHIAQKLQNLEFSLIFSDIQVDFEF